MSKCFSYSQSPNLSLEPNAEETPHILGYSRKPLNGSPLILPTGIPVFLKRTYHHTERPSDNTPFSTTITILHQKKPKHTICKI